MKLKFSEKVNDSLSKPLGKPVFNQERIFPREFNNPMDSFIYSNSYNELGVARGDVQKRSFNSWNLGFIFLFFSTIFLVILSSVINLQVVQGQELARQSERNFAIERYEYPPRGIVYDRNGIKLAENVPSYNLYLNVTTAVDEDGKLDESRIRQMISDVDPIIKDAWIVIDDKGEKVFKNLEEKIFKSIEDNPESSNILIAEGLGNEVAISLRSSEVLNEALYLDRSTKRFYPEGESFAHILGYTGGVTKEDMDANETLGLNDVIGKYGVEKFYDEELIGQKGLKEQEYDVYGNALLEEARITKQAVSGDNLHLAIDAQAQKKMYEELAKGVEKYEATGAVGILQDVRSGEIIVFANYPSYDNNKFIGGISVEEYKQLLEDPKFPLLNRGISAQLPPGSTFKTLAAAAALDAGAINKSTIYVSSTGYTFSNGAKFQEYNNSAYGPINVVTALGKSSNQFFCDTIRNWSIDEYVEYLTNFGIGQATGIDLIGESLGMLPSPANKIKLAKTSSPWLEPVWYPEGDSCNTVIGQGITTVTPIQMVNWTSAIANDGTLYTPHVAKYFESSKGEKKEVSPEPLHEEFIGEEALRVVREGMRLSVTSRVIWPLDDLSVPMAAKTGTAEFGKLNADGRYEHNHAWVTGFFPYDKPQYAFTLLLEDGGQSFHTAEVAKEFLAWWIEYSK